MAVHIIAEAGSNHNGSLEMAFQLNAVAGIAGANSVKYQIIYPEGLYLPGDYPYGHYDIRQVWRIRECGVMADVEWETICHDAIAKGVHFTASVFDRRGLDLLCRMSPPYIKTASCDLNNIWFLREVASRGIPMVVSTGMSTLGDIEKAVTALDKEGMNGERLVLLHCVSAYPTELEHTNLGFLHTLRNAFGTAVGFSDHTLGCEAACAAVALGATWIEKHFTIDRNLEGFDHKYALEPADLNSYVTAIRAVERSMAWQVSKILRAERDTRSRARRGLYAARHLPAGHVVTWDDLLILRPEGPIPVDLADMLVGTKLRQDISMHSPFTFAVLESPSDHRRALSSHTTQ